MKTEELLTETNEFLREIRNWIRAAHHGTVGQALTKLLDTEKKRKAFQMADGNTPLADVCKKCSMSKTSLVELYRDAVKRGLMESDDNGRKRRLFDLENFGLLGGPNGFAKDTAACEKENDDGIA